MSFNYINSIETVSINSIESNDSIHEVLNALKVNPKPVVIDDHNGGHSNLSYEGVMVFIKNAGYTYLVPEMESTVFCLNPLYVDKDGNVHLSTASCGGVVHHNERVESLGLKLARISESYSPEFLAKFQD